MADQIKTPPAAVPAGPAADALTGTNHRAWVPNHIYNAIVGSDAALKAEYILPRWLFIVFIWMGQLEHHPAAKGGVAVEIATAKSGAIEVACCIPD